MADGSDIVERLRLVRLNGLFDASASLQLPSDGERVAVLLDDIEAEITRLRAQAPVWRTMESAPTNQRVIVQANNATTDETAMAWKDRMDKRWYYAPQGGLLAWDPTHWQPLPAPPKGEGGE